MSSLFDKILCPVDFDENSMAALDLACKVATQNDARLYVMHVAPFPLAAGQIGPLPYETMPLWEREATVKLEQIARERIPGGVQCEILTRSGMAAETIVGAETELGIGLVVMATHGHRRSVLGHLFLGSVAERVVRESVCPILVVPPR